MADSANAARDKRRKQQKIRCVNCHQLTDSDKKCQYCGLNPKVVNAPPSKERKQGGIKVRVDKKYGYYRRGAHAH